MTAYLLESSQARFKNVVYCFQTILWLLTLEREANGSPQPLVYFLPFEREQEVHKCIHLKHSELCISQIEASTSPLRAYPGHLTSFLTREGGNLITAHRGWGIWSLASMSCYEINHGGDVKLWWIQRKRLRICGGLVEKQRPTQVVFRIWRCLRPIYIYSM